MIACALKRLCSNEATRSFWHEVPPSEKEYHAAVAEPICLKQIDARVTAREYAAWGDFADDVTRMIANAMAFNADDSIQFLLASILQKEFDIAVEEVRTHAPSLLGDDA